jgi:putative transposase
MGLAVSSYYYQRTRNGLKVHRDLLLKDKIDQIHAEFPYYGYRRLQGELKAQGMLVNHKRLKRVMKLYGIYTQIPRSFKVTTQSRHPHKRYSNLIKKVVASGPNQIWGTDMTYIRIYGGFVYLAVVLDLFSRKIVGWSLGPRLTAELALAAITRAIARRKPRAGCIHHSDQGVQYCCAQYIDLLKHHQFKISMSRTGNPYDNAMVESFMRTLKMEEVYLAQYKTYQDVVERVPKFIEDVYNKKRLHSSLGYQSPQAYEANYNRTI